MEKYFETKKIEDATHIKVSSSYQLGGWNPFTHKEEKRGIYVSFTPVKRLPRDGYHIEMYTAFTGMKVCVKELKRDSRKSEEEIWSILQESIDMLVSMFEDGRKDLVGQHLMATDWTPRKKFYVVCSDKMWKDKLVCECKDLLETELVENKWKYHSEKIRVRTVMTKPSYQATWYKVSDNGSIVKMR